MSHWERFGYNRGVATAERPALAYKGDFFLAFKSLHEDEICIGKLTIESSGTDRAGHGFQSLRTDKPGLNCGL